MLEMLETLKKLKINSMLTIDDEISKDFTGREDFVVLDSKHYQSEESELLILDLDDYFLIAHTLDGDPKFFIYEINHNNILNEDNEPPTEIIVTQDDEEDTCYIQIEEYAASLTNEDGDEVDIYEYSSEEGYFSNLLIEICSDDQTIYQGFEIKEDNIVI